MEHRYLDQEIECASREDMRKLQSERLAKMVKNAYEHVPFYREKLDSMGIKPEDIQSIDDITKLPFTLKTDLRDHYPFGLFAVGKEDLARIHASSGTTGHPTVVGYTQHDLDVWAHCIARGLTSIGMTKADTVQIAYGYGLFTGGLGFHDGAGALGMTVIPASSGNTNRQIAMLQDYGTDLLCCTPSYAMYIGETMKEKGIDPKSLPLRATFCGAEPWTEEMRKEMEALLDVRAYDVYGLSEIAGPGVAMECYAQAGMHIAEDYFYPEVIDPDTGEPVEDGQYGELVFTCIGKEALPLIRYRTRDICKLERSKCACGRTTVRMMKPQGRTDDMLIIRGINVFPSQIESVLLSLGMEPNYQMIVDRKGNLDTLEVQIEMAEEMFSDTMKNLAAAEKRIAEALKSTLNIVAKVRLLEPKSLPRSEGKAKRVIDNRKL
ncbi:MAG: phenylacetate--CoA ligase [Oscillospiraceae bacterium]|nr:phenylacetate--CoA ligase [Oscillospiraceae bacterium]